MQIISTIGLITINETMIVQLVSFLIFLFIINRVMFRPLQAAMTEREQYVDTIQTDILESQNTVKELQARIEEQELGAKKDGFQIKENLEAAGSEQAAKIFAEAQREISDMRSDAEQQIQQQLDDARKIIESESERLAADIMEKVLQRRLAS